MKIKFLSVFLFFSLMTSTLMANRTITDQLGRKVNLPDEVNRIVVLQHQSLNVLNQINALDKVVGILQTWEKVLGKNYARLALGLKNLPTPGDLKTINYEALMKLNPDVVIVANYIPEEYILKLEELNIPVIAISFFKTNKMESSKLNPTFEDEVQAYNEGFYEAVELLGEISNHTNEAKELIKYIQKSQQELSDNLKKINITNKARIYMANPELTTYGSGKYTGIFFKRAGGVNVAEKSIKGYKQISAETLISWNPDIIFVQDRYTKVPNELKNNPLLKNLKAIKENKIYMMPEYAKAWGYPTPEAMALGEEWLSIQLYPEYFDKNNFDKKVEEYYNKFYRTSYK